MNSHFSPVYRSFNLKIPKLPGADQIETGAKTPLISAEKKDNLSRKVSDSALSQLSSESNNPRSLGWPTGIFSWINLGIKQDLIPEDESDTFGWGWGDLDEEDIQEFNEKDELPLFEKGTIKTYQAAKKGWSQYLLGEVLEAGLDQLSPVIRTIASSYQHFDEEKVISSQKKEMLNQLDDPLYVEFYEVVEAALIPMIKENVLASLATKCGAVPALISSQHALIVKMSKVILARGFANLAKEVKANQDQISNFDDQPSLVSVICLLCEKSGQHINPKVMERIEKKYQKNEQKLAVLIDKLFPGVGDRVDDKASLECYIKEYIASSDVNRKKAIKHDLFPLLNLSMDSSGAICGYDDKQKIEIDTFFFHLEALHAKHQELDDLFKQVSHDILLCLFPHKLSDIKEISGLLTNLQIPGIMNKNVGDTLFDLIQDSVADLLRDSYLPLEHNHVRNEKWEMDLNDRIGAPDLKSVLKAPSALLTAFAKQYIQSDPTVIETVGDVIDRLLHPSPSEAEKNDLDQLAHHNLADWLVRTVQILMSAENPQLSGLSGFGQQMMNNLTLALMAKGAALVIPQDVQIKPEKFIEEFSQRLIEKKNEMEGDVAISPEFWIHFMGDLPLPPILRELLIPILIKKGGSLKTQANAMNLEFEQVRVIHQEAFKKMQGYEGGEQFISITEQVSERIIEQVVGKNIELVTAFGLGETLEELLANYLPGVRVSDELKMWFKQNISSLGEVSEGEAPVAVSMLKDCLQAVLLKSIVNTIEKNFKNDGKDYAAQLLGNIHDVFSKAFDAFDDDQRAQLDAAIKIQDAIEEKSQQIERIKGDIPPKPDITDFKGKKKLEGLIEVNLRYVRATDDVERLTKKRDDVLDSLNQQVGHPFNLLPSQLDSIGEWVVRRKIETAQFKSKQDEIKNLEGEISRLNVRMAIVGPLSKLKQELKENECLLSLLQLPGEQFRLIVDALNIQSTLKQAARVQDTLSEELEEKKEAFDNYKSKNQPNWNEVKEWIHHSIRAKLEVKMLSLEIESLEEDLDAQLSAFRVLSKELVALIGWDKKESLDLPPSLQGHVWSLIESIQDKQVARLLFRQVAPFFTCIQDVEKKQARLKNLVEDDPFLGELIHAVSEDLISRIPDYVTSYKPIAKNLLEEMGLDHPSEGEVARMESALCRTLIELGKDGVKASMLKPFLKGLVSVEEEEELSESIAKLIEEGKMCEEEIADLLEPFSNESEGQAKHLAREINQLMLNRGKGRLTVDHLIKAYNKQASRQQQKLLPRHQSHVRSKLMKKRMVEKIQSVVITPEEIAEALNAVIPGATDLHLLLAPQLQAVLVGEEAPFKMNREMLQKFLEGTLLTLLINMAEHHQGEVGQTTLEVATEKLKDLADKAVPLPGQNPEERARQIIDEVVKDLLNLDSKEQLKMIPLSLQQLVYDKIKEQAYRQFTPFILPIIERNENRLVLADLSGSDFMGSLCQALSKDLFKLTPAALNSYRAIAKDILEDLSDDYTDLQAEELGSQIGALVKEKNVKHHLIVQAYAKVMKKKMSEEEKNQIKERLKKGQFKNKIKAILTTPEEIAASIGQAIPHLNEELQKKMSKEIQSFIQGGSDAYSNSSDFIAAYLEAVLLKVFIGIAQKNPKQEDATSSDSSKDSVIVLTEKLLTVIHQKYQQARTEDDFSKLARELNDALMKDLLGIDSPSAFKGLPDSIQKAAYDAVKDQIAGIIQRVGQSLRSIESGNDKVKKVKEEVKKLGISQIANQATLHVLVEDLAHLVVDSIPHTLAEKIGEAPKGVVTISKGIENYVENLARGQLQIADVLLGYTETRQLKSILGEGLTHFADKGHFQKDKEAVVDLLANLLLEPLGKVIERAINFEEEHQKEFNQELMTNFLQIAAEHLKCLNDAKELAAAKGEKNFQHEDFIEAAGSQLHSAIPKNEVNYQESVNAIKEKLYPSLSLDEMESWLAVQGDLRALIAQTSKEEIEGRQVIDLDQFCDQFASIHLKVTAGPFTDEDRNTLKSRDKDGLTLRDIIRKESEAPAHQRLSTAYGPATQVILKMLFPNGKKELTFVPEELRETVWNLLKTQLFPVLLPMMTELVLDPAMIHTIILNSLNNLNAGLSEEIKPNGAAAPDQQPLDPLDEVAGELIYQALRATTLPSWVKNRLYDSKTGEINEGIKRSLGGTFRSQFNDTFIKEKLQIALENVIKRGEDEKPNIAFDSRDKTIKQEERRKNAEKMEKDLKKAFRQTIDVSLSYFIRSQWVAFQSSCDKLIEKTCGKAGRAVKRCLDAVCRFIFFKLVGTVINWFTYPLRVLFKEIIYERILKLDESRKQLIGLLTAVPLDQPEAGFKQHGVYNEDLIFKIAEALNKTVREFLDDGASTLSSEI